MQLPTPEQQFVDDVQGAPCPSAMQPGLVVDVVEVDVEVVVGGAVVDVDDVDVVVDVVVDGFVVAVLEVDVLEVDVVVGGAVVEVLEVDVLVLVVLVVAGVSLNDQSDQPMRSWPYWFQTGFLPPVIDG